MGKGLKAFTRTWICTDSLTLVIFILKKKERERNNIMYNNNSSKPVCNCIIRLGGGRGGGVELSHVLQCDVWRNINHTSFLEAGASPIHCHHFNICIANVNERLQGQRNLAVI